MEFKHVTVLLRESVDSLDVKPDGIYVDCTAGGGGHSAAVLARLNENGRMILIDQDPDAIATVTERFKGDSRVTIVHSNFSNIEEKLAELALDKSISGKTLFNPKMSYSMTTILYNRHLLSVFRVSAYGSINFPLVLFYISVYKAVINS